MKRLSEIESAAAAIVEHAEAQKAVLDREYEELRRNFDEALEADTQAKIQGIRDELEGGMAKLLEEQSCAASNSIAALRKEFEEKHTIYARQILKNITEV